MRMFFFIWFPFVQKAIYLAEEKYELFFQVPCIRGLGRFEPQIYTYTHARMHTNTHMGLIRIRNYV